MTVRTVAIVQARLGSSRLPGKVLLPFRGEPMLAHVMHRAARATSLDDVVLATTLRPEDDPIVELARDRGWPVERGSEVDLLDRYLQAARHHDAEVIVRITSDCPLIDPEIIDLAVGAFGAAQADYASNTLEPRTYPRGLDVEVIARAALERAGAEDHNMAWREHATPYIYRHPELFQLVRVASAVDYSQHRWSVDTVDDYELVRRLFEELDPDTVAWHDVLALLARHPDWELINRDVPQKTVPEG